MNPSNPTLADEIMRIVQINRTVINGLRCGSLVFRTHEGRLVEVSAQQTLKLSAGAQLCPLLLKGVEKE